MKKFKINYNVGIIIYLGVFFAISQPVFSSNKDSIQYSKPNEFHGLLLKDTSNTINKTNIQRINYSSMYDILNTRNELFGMSLGINGHQNSFLSYGSLNQNIFLGSNGRQLTNNYNGGYNSENFSPEFFERIEVLNGSNATILSAIPNSTFLNFQEIIYNTKTPFTRLWYAQEGGSFISADGIFSQNFAKGWNFTFGFKKMDDRLAFDNMSTDYWNLRFILRYNIDSTSSLSLTDNFINNKTITNGGSNPDNSLDIYSPINSTPFYSRIELREYRHDMNLTYTNRMDFFNLTNTLFFTNNENIRGLPQLSESDTIGNGNNTETQIGNRLNLDFIFNNIEFKVGSNLNYFESDGTNFFNPYEGLMWNLYSRAKLNFSDFTILTGGVNYGNDGVKDFFGFGERLELVSENLVFYIDHSFITKNGLINSDVKNETTNLFISGLKISNDIRFEAFYRVVTSAIFNRLTNSFTTEQYNIGNYQAIGGSASYKSEVYSSLFDKSDILTFFAQTRFNLINGNDELKNFYPLFTFNGGLNYKLMVNQSELNLGFRAGILDSKSAPRYIPISNSYIQNDNNVGIQTTGLNLYSTMKLGNAFVKIEWENLLDANYYYVAFYPERGQIVKLSVAWSFFD